MTTQPAVFLDRDGVINPMVYYEDHGIVDSPFTLEQFSVFPTVPKAVRLLNDLGFSVIVVSNQPGIAKGHFSLNLLPQIERKTQHALEPAGAHIDAFYYCLHHPEAIIESLRISCQCRKPGPGLLLRAATEMQISLADSYMVGDGLTDVEAGRRSGCHTIFLGTWKCDLCQVMKDQGSHPEFVAHDLAEAAQFICDRSLPPDPGAYKRNRICRAG